MSAHTAQLSHFTSSAVLESESNRGKSWQSPSFFFIFLRVLSLLFVNEKRRPEYAIQCVRMKSAPYSPWSSRCPGRRLLCRRTGVEQGMSNAREQEK